MTAGVRMVLLLHHISQAYRNGRADIQAVITEETLQDPLALYLRTEALRLVDDAEPIDRIEDLLFRMELTIDHSIRQLTDVKQEIRDRLGQVEHA